MYKAALVSEALPFSVMLVKRLIKEGLGVAVFAPNLGLWKWVLLDEKLHEKVHLFDLNGSKPSAGFDYVVLVKGVLATPQARARGAKDSIFFRSISSDKNTKSLTISAGEAVSMFASLAPSSSISVSFTAHSTIGARLLLDKVTKALFSFGDGKSKKILVETGVKKLFIPILQKQKTGTPRQFATPLFKRLVTALPKNIKKGFYKNVLYLSVLVLVFPLLLLLFSFAMLSFSLGAYAFGKPNFVVQTSKAALVFAEEALALSVTYSSVPVLDLAGQEYIALATTGKAITEVGREVFAIINKGEALGSFVLGNVAGDIKDYSQGIALGIDNAYYALNFYESETTKGKGLFYGIMRSVLASDNYSTYKQNVLEIGNLIKYLPQILGDEKPTTYLVLFTDSNYLTGGGGVIDSFALVTFANGKIVDMGIVDNDNIDKNVKGRVVRPDAVGTHLGEGNWLFGDSNWATNFYENADNATWFLDKGMGEKVDGVISIDLVALTHFVEIVGPVEVLSEGKLVRSGDVDNLEKTGILNDIARSLLGEITGSDKQVAKLSMAAFGLLREKHIVVYLNNPSIQSSIVQLGWTDPPIPPRCPNNCLRDVVKVADTVLTKTPFRILEREMYFHSTIEPTVSKKLLTVVYTNEGDTLQNIFGRIVTSKESDLGPVELLVDGKLSVVEPQIVIFDKHKESGIAFDIFPGTSTSVTYYWEEPVYVNFLSSGKYILDWQKQPGTSNDKVHVKVDFPDGIALGGSWTGESVGGIGSLTAPASFSYNAKRNTEYNAKRNTEYNAKHAVSYKYSTKLLHDLRLTNFWVDTSL